MDCPGTKTCALAESIAAPSTGGYRDCCGAACSSAVDIWMVVPLCSWPWDQRPAWLGCSDTGGYSVCCVFPLRWLAADCDGTETPPPTPDSSCDGRRSPRSKQPSGCPGAMPSPAFADSARRVCISHVGMLLELPPPSSFAKRQNSRSEEAVDQLGLQLLLLMASLTNLTTASAGAGSSHSSAKISGLQVEDAGSRHLQAQ